jgi:hypothetical protein
MSIILSSCLLINFNGFVSFMHGVVVIQTLLNNRTKGHMELLRGDETEV